MSTRIVVGDALAELAKLPVGSVQSCVTSPPYFGLRNYGIAGQIGLEADPQEYVARLVEVFREVKRVLAVDGTLWLNLGDSYAAGGNAGGGSFAKERRAWDGGMRAARNPRAAPLGYKAKDLLLMPFEVASALRADGWYLRACNVWAKMNGMPSSVKDRPTLSHEYVFLLSKSRRYHYDDAAVRTPLAPTSEMRLAQDVVSQEGSHRANGGGKTNGTMKAVRRRSVTRYGCGGVVDSEVGPRDQGANLRSVWWLATEGNAESHFAMMPTALARVCVLAGSRPGDTVLDPFGGAGTTGLVADRLGRNAILIELNPAYAKMAERRIQDDAPLFVETYA